MGTNFYAHTNVCPHCGRPEEAIHIGKSSMGWKFVFHMPRIQSEEPPYHTEHRWKSIEDFKNWLREQTIVDEYGRKEESFDLFWAYVEDKQDGLMPGDGSEYGGNDPHGNFLLDGYRFDTAYFS